MPLCMLILYTTQCCSTNQRGYHDSPILQALELPPRAREAVFITNSLVITVRKTAIWTKQRQNPANKVSHNALFWNLQSKSINERIYSDFHRVCPRIRVHNYINPQISSIFPIKTNRKALHGQAYLIDSVNVLLLGIHFVIE